MRFYRLRFWNGFGGGRETHDGVFALFGEIPEAGSRDDVNEIWVPGERKEEIERRVHTWADEFWDFLIARHNVREIARYYGGSAWFLLIPYRDPDATLRKTVSCEEVLARLPPESYAKLSLEFWVSVEAKVIPRASIFSDKVGLGRPEAGSDRSAWLVHLAAEQADELIAAMGTGRYQFLSVSLFTQEEQVLATAAERIGESATGEEFLRTLLAMFPTLFLVDWELLVLVWSRDHDFLRDFVSALGGRLPPQLGGAREKGIPLRRKRREFSLMPKQGGRHG